MPQSPALRRALPSDVPAAYAVFRRSIYDYLFRQGLVDEASAKNPPIESAWRRQEAWIEHLWQTSAENWVAEDETGRIIGWALAVERDGHRELSMYFVAPGQQGKGLGRALIDRVFPPDGDGGRSVMATLDAAALGVYLRSGVSFATTAVDLLVKGQPVQARSDLTFRRLDPDDSGIATVIAIERAVLGFSRAEDIRFLLQSRAAWAALRDGMVVGYAFGPQPNPPGADDMPPSSGPMAALEPSDVAALVDHVIAEAPTGQEFFISVPFANSLAMIHLLTRGARIDPFYIMVLTSDPKPKLDRYIHTSPYFII